MLWVEPYSNALTNAIIFLCDNDLHRPIQKDFDNNTFQYNNLSFTKPPFCF